MSKEREKSQRTCQLVKKRRTVDYTDHSLDVSKKKGR